MERGSRRCHGTVMEINDRAEPAAGGKVKIAVCEVKFELKSDSSTNLNPDLINKRQREKEEQALKQSQGGKPCECVNTSSMSSDRAIPLLVSQSDSSPWAVQVMAFDSVIDQIKFTLDIEKSSHSSDRGLDVFMSRFMDVNETLGILYLIFLIQG
ncbi:hypothetical protein HGM15179_008870 [Zosterops borbonicus]|uniref:Uncharacterized protein n=1 Tax=Zosterops borbonicus TaxID=364589 RepID=A0A8K1GI67_9PASS|nr:hypothetical protein HGM15179_008870 [Zosterops borbonicus]